jgi:hypothetical protein
MYLNGSDLLLMALDGNDNITVYNTSINMVMTLEGNAGNDSYYVIGSDNGLDLFVPSSIVSFVDSFDDQFNMFYLDLGRLCHNHSHISCTDVDVVDMT